MLVLRSFLYNILFFGIGISFAVALLPVLVFPRSVLQKGLKLWAWVILRGLKPLAGLTWQVKGLENLPDEPCIFACKHQSAWETGAFYLLVNDPAYILKQELLSIPFFGWHLRRSGAISIDRKAGASALKKMISGTKERIARGQNVVIFPEGTRAHPGKPGTYHPGIAALYRGTDAPVIPVALNSGLFWQRRSFLKRPGCITIEFLPAMEQGLDRKAFMKDLQDRMETTTNLLIEDARANCPQALPALEPSENDVSG
ncbi:MAG: 1-acyl-sn-glycerol-3-phosphate acyltransferase [Rhodospirillaceae bacterium]|nr:MAG: 1-acyl-sn-glycerol-3-phosphate acyltransferase [Rhodospirillaceae bacterium]